MQCIVISLSIVYDSSITLVSPSVIYSQSILESQFSHKLLEKTKELFFVTVIKLTNGLLIGTSLHMTVFIHLLGMCYLIY